jgi:hypothetical protein
MDESPQMTLSEVYAPTVNESETITNAKRVRSTFAVPETAPTRSGRGSATCRRLRPSVCGVDRKFSSFS